MNLKNNIVITGIILFNFINFSCDAKNNNLQEYQPIIENKIKIQSNSEKIYLGKWILNTYIGDKIFKDKLNLQKIDNKLSGTLNVPNVFSSKLEKIKILDNKLYFEILVNEGQKPYRVKYDCTIHEKGDSFIGFASIYETNELIGGFVAIKDKEGK
jgi:hypothetical protein